MNIAELKQQIDGAPVSQRAALQKMYLYATAGGNVLPALAAHLEAAGTY